MWMGLVFFIFFPDFKYISGLLLTLMYVHLYPFKHDTCRQCRMYEKLCKKIAKLKDDFSRCGWV